NGLVNIGMLTSGSIEHPSTAVCPYHKQVVRIEPEALHFDIKSDPVQHVRLGVGHGYRFAGSQSSQELGRRFTDPVARSGVARAMKVQGQPFESISARS